MGTGIGLIVTTSVGIYSVIQLQQSISFIDSHCNGYCIDHGMDDSETTLSPGAKRKGTIVFSNIL